MTAENRSAAALAVWQSTTPADGTLIGTYLAARGIRIPASACLRFHPGLNHKNGGRWPAMVALIQHASDGESIGIHPYVSCAERFWQSSGGTGQDDAGLRQR